MGQAQAQMRPRHATEAEKQMLADLTEKVVRDVHKALELTLPLVADEFGPVGIFAVTQKVMCVFAMGAAMAFTALQHPNDNETLKAKIGAKDGKHKTVDDDLLFVCLLAYTAESGRNTGEKDAVDRAIAMFQEVRGYAPNKPYGW